MSASVLLSCPTSLLQNRRCSFSIRSLPHPQHFLIKSQRFFPKIQSSTGNTSSLETGVSTELDAVSEFSEIVPDTVVFDDFDRFPPTAATVSSSLLLGICSLPDTKFKSAIETALADGECYLMEDSRVRMSCFLNKALVNVGADLTKFVPGRVSTEVDARLAYDTHGILRKAAAAAQAGASVIQIFVGRIRDWARNHSGDPEVEAACRSGEDPGLALVTKAYNYIHKHGHKSKLMAAAIRNKQDIFSLMGIDYIIAPLKILQSLKESIILPDEKYSFARRLSPSSSMMYNFSEEELVKWDQLSFATAIGPAAEDLLGAGLESYMKQTRRVEELFGKIWPPPNV